MVGKWEGNSANPHEFNKNPHVFTQLPCQITDDIFHRKTADYLKISVGIVVKSPAKQRSSVL
jgi:hypothetical protein